MKVLHLVHSFPPESKGGTETYVEGIARAQVDLGWEVVVWAGTEVEGLPAAARFSGVGVRRRPPVDRGKISPEGLDPAFQGELEAVLGEVSPDLVHLHHWHNLSIDAVASVRERGVPAVVTLHDLYSVCPRFFRVPDGRTLCPTDVGLEECARCVAPLVGTDPRALEPLVNARQAALTEELRRAGAVLTLSATQDAYLSRVPALEGIETRVLPFPRPALDPVPAPPLLDGRLRILSWGGLAPGKGLDAIVSACAESPHAAAFSVRHAGRILDEGYADRLRRSGGATTVELLGPFESTRLPQLAREADLAAFPSRFFETHGIAVDEGLSLGLPVVVTDRGAPQERVGERGIVVPVEDVEALRRVLEDLLAHPERLAAMRAAQPRLGPTMREHAEAMAEVYSALVS